MRRGLPIANKALELELLPSCDSVSSSRNQAEYMQGVAVLENMVVFHFGSVYYG